MAADTVVINSGGANLSSVLFALERLNALKKVRWIASASCPTRCES
jgi:hypothetical protein